MKVLIVHFRSDPSSGWQQKFQSSEASEADSAERSIRTGDFVEIYNNRGKTKAYAVIDPGCRKGTAIFEQGWWARYLKNESYNSLTMPWIKPLHEIYFVPGIWTPTTVWNECLVDVRRITA